MQLGRRTMLGLSAAVLATPVLGGSRTTAQDATPAATSESLELYLLTIRGTLLPPTIEEARSIHNATAGAAESIAAARSLGDVSHMVYSPVPPATTGAGEVLFLDYWTSADGLNQFFANPQVQEQAAEIFSDRDPAVWVPADGFVTYHLPAPYGQNDRIVVIVQGSVASHDEAKALHNSIVANHIGEARIAGDLSHEAYFRLAAPDSAESLDYLAIDIWKSAEGLQEFYARPELQEAFSGLFTASPTVSIWTNAPGEWAEW